jgi:tetratricopeptide (TPR) repeat protein
LRTAEQLEANGDFVGAAEKLKRADELFAAVRKYYPAWRPEMVAGRSARNTEALDRIRPKAEEQRIQNRRAVAELEGGVKKSGTLEDPADGILPAAPGIFEVNPVETRKLAEAEAEVKRLRELANENAKDNGEASRNASRVGDLSRQRDALQAQLNAAEANLKTLRGRLAASPVENELKGLNQRIAALQQEREAMGMALNQSRTQHTEALSRLAILEADIKVVQQKRADLDRNLKAEREISNEVVQGQRTQLREREKEIAALSEELGQAKTQIAGLQRELQESRDSFAQLRSEHDAVVQERNQMQALLNLDKESRIMEVVEQNAALQKNLREANERVEALSKDSNTTKELLAEAKRDLTMAKFQINRLHQEKRQQDAQLVELEKRLKGEEAALAGGEASTDPAEVEMLREIIRKQIRAQHYRSQARDLLVEAVKDMGAKDERIAQAIQLFDGREVQLTAEEQKLIADKQVDGEFISPFAQDSATVGRNTEVLQRDIAVYERTAEKSFAAGRYLPTRELFQMIVEQHPGHVPALCKLGVVDLKLNDPSSAAETFRRAVELDANNPYAHRMLGLSLYQLGEFQAAGESVKEAVKLAPDDAKSQSLLGAIAEELGRPGEAESYYKAAISADPMVWQPYLNIARLCAHDKRFDTARDYYQQALERQAVPDPKLEQLLAKP